MCLVINVSIPQDIVYQPTMYGFWTKKGHFLLRPAKIGMNKIGTSEKWNGDTTVNALRTIASSRSSSNIRSFPHG